MTESLALDYIDFALHITPGPNGTYCVTAKAALPDKELGECDGIMTLPPHIGEMAADLRGGRRKQRSTRELMRDGDEDAPVASTNAGDVEKFGVDLFNALFADDDVRELFSGMNYLAKSSNTGVRIRLSVGVKGDDMTAIASLPWEMMTRKLGESPLALSRKTVFARSLKVLQPSDALPFKAPLRILIIQSNPRGTAPLNLEAEKAKILADWGRQPGVEIVFEEPVMQRLRTRLANEDFHVVHYMGHGEFNAATGRGALLFEMEHGDTEGEHGEKYSADAQELGDLIAAEPKLRLMFLNACKSATGGDAPAMDPFGGVAQHLISRGVPAVIAMQYPISDIAATTFAGTFYQRVVAGHPVDAAVAEARKELGTEWATPVLYMRSRNGILFDSPATSAPTPASPLQAPVNMSQVPEAKAVTVFLARPTDDGDTAVVERVKAHLASMGVGTVTLDALNHAEHAARMKEITSSANLLVHFMGTTPGVAIPGGDGQQTYAVEEMKIGLLGARPQLILRPEGFTIDAEKYPAYAEEMKLLENAPRNRERLEIVHAAARQVVDIVATRVSAIMTPPAASTPAVASATASRASQPPGVVNKVYVEMHRTDRNLMPDLQEHLQSRSIEPVFRMSAEGTPAATEAEFEEKVKNNPLMIVVYGAVEREWVKNRVDRAAQTRIESNPDMLIGVLAVPPKKREELKFGRQAEVSAGAQAFDPAAIDALIERAREG